MRGQTNDFGIGTDPAVAVYVDGVYVGRSGSAMLHFNDIERVEVLRGPQAVRRNRAAGGQSERGAVVGTLDGSDDWYRFTLEDGQFAYRRIGFTEAHRLHAFNGILDQKTHNVKQGASPYLDL